MTKKKSVAEQRKKTPVVKGHLSENPSGGGWRLFRFWCPFCRTYHQHGFPPAEEYNRRKKYSEHRVAHCYVESPFREYGYFLQPFTAKELEEMSLTTKISTPCGVKESSRL